MSEASYPLNVSHGVTGPQSSTCLMAAYDRISPVLGISTETYRAHEELRNLFACIVGDGSIFTPSDMAKIFTELKQIFRAELGLYTPKNIIEVRVDTGDELRSALTGLPRTAFGQQSISMWVGFMPLLLRQSVKILTALKAPGRHLKGKRAFLSLKLSNGLIEHLAREGVSQAAKEPNQLVTSWLCRQSQKVVGHPIRICKMHNKERSQ